MNHSRAFTLLEMIVAIAIFAIIAIVSYATLNRFLDNSATLEEELEDLKQLQLTFSLLEQDMHFISERMTRDAYGDTEPLLVISDINVAGELLRFTTARRDIILPGESSLQRMSYRWENGDFVRASWLVLDRDQDAKESKYLLLADVESVSVKVLIMVDGEMKVESSWEPGNLLPDGVEWNITMEDGRQYRRIFEVKHARRDN
ncbi:MAG: type II secretion system minor pseudopilin GspJ [Arenicellales bacterium]